MTQHGLLVIGHGSRLAYNSELIEEVAAMASGRCDEYLIQTCFMEFNEPDIASALTAMKNADIDMLVVFPLFLAKGVHVLHDIPEILGLPDGMTRGSFTLNSGRTVALIYAEPIGADPYLADLLLNNVRQAVNTQ